MKQKKPFADVLYQVSKEKCPKCEGELQPLSFDFVNGDFAPSKDLVCKKCGKMIFKN